MRLKGLSWVSGAAGEESSERKETDSFDFERLGLRFRPRACGTVKKLEGDAAEGESGDVDVMFAVAVSRLDNAADADAALDADSEDDVEGVGLRLLAQVIKHYFM
jgi:hypothetical protein